MFEFEDLDDFIKNSNNFFLFFTKKSWVGKVYREAMVFDRFRKKYPEFEKELTNSIDIIMKDNPHYFSKTLPWDKLYEAYKLMMPLVQETDPYVMINNKIDSRYLCR